MVLERKSEHYKDVNFPETNLHMLFSSHQNSNGMGWERGGGFRRERTYVYLVWFILMYGRGQHDQIRSDQSLSHVQLFAT